MEDARRARTTGIIAVALLALAACAQPPPPSDLLDAASALREANVAGQSREWVLDQRLTAVRLNDVVRRAYPAAPPSRLRFVVDIPKGAHLTFACGIDPARHARPGVEFAVKVAKDGRETRVFSQLLDPLHNPQHRRWLSADIDLSAHAGRNVDLIFETHGYDETGEANMAYWGTPALTVPKPAPLVVLYLVDTLRADHTSPYGYARDTTPRLAELARDAVVFEQAIAQASWTKPSVASILTSLPPHRHQVVQLGDALDVKLVTLPERLELNGFTTGAVLSNVVVYGKDTHFDQGFDFFAGLHGARDLPTKTVRAAPVVDAALAWLDARRGHRQFLFVHTMDPHVPYTPPPPYDRLYEPHPAPGHPASDPRTATGDPLDRDRFVAQYDGEIAYGDREFGRFIDGLKARGLYDQALIVFVSDHGEEFLDHAQWLHGRSVFDEVVRVPLIVKFPGARYRGRRVAQQVAMLDIVPTILSAMDLSVPGAPEIEGRPLQPALDGTAPARPALSEITHRGYVAYGVRTEKDKYVRRYSPEQDPFFGAQQELYFDLTRDPQERVNRLGENGARASQARPSLDVALLASPFSTLLRLTGTGEYHLRLHTQGAIEYVEIPDLGHAEQRTQPTPGELDLKLVSQARRPRSVRFSVKPLGAPVWLDATRNGRALAPASIFVGEQGQHPTSVPFRLPEAEVEGVRKENVFAAPRTPEPGLHVWLAPRAGRAAPVAIDNRENCEQLKALGYVADCPAQ
jgi:arylsulfatase A-like enzyme